MLADDDVFEFAKRCARTYCATYGAWRNLDDAVGDACLYLLSNRALWEKSRSALLCRVVNALIRNYQNERGLRLKNPPRRTEFFEPSARDDSDSLEYESQAERAERALKAPENAQDRPIIEAVLEGRKKKDVAREFNVSAGRVSQIMAIYKNSVSRLSEERGASLVDPKEENVDPATRESTPLFYS